jgi:hypothetical protein
MSSPRRSSDHPLDTLSVKLGNWFEAQATGRGVIAVPIVVLIVVAAVAVKVLFLR